MFGRLFRRKENVQTVEVSELARTEAGTRIYCIGDIHGRSDLLDIVSDFIAEDMKSATGEVVTICIGDYIDRGPDSAGVIERLSAGGFPTALICLLGNHEDMLLKFLQDETVLEDWRRFGGLETLGSYGVSLADVVRGGKYGAVQAALLAAMPMHHRTFLDGAQLSTQSGDYFFCHAGVRPEVPLAEQKSIDLLKIRQPFISYDGNFGKIIVHGHTRVRAIDVKHNRINIDTGAFATDNLTCIVLEDDTLRLFQTAPVV